MLGTAFWAAWEELVSVEELKDAIFAGKEALSALRERKGQLEPSFHSPGP